MFGLHSSSVFFSCLGLASAVFGVTEVEEELFVRQSYSGEATVYSNDGTSGSCGYPLYDSDYIVALSDYFMNYQYKSPYCGRQITLTNTGDPYGGVNGQGNSVTVTVADTCSGCSETHIDLSEAAWNSLTSGSAFGVADINWQFDS